MDQLEEEGVQPVPAVDFNQADWQTQWVHDNPEVVIPEPVPEEKDNDWYMTKEDEELIIAAYFQAKEQTQVQQPPGK